MVREHTVLAAHSQAFKLRHLLLSPEHNYVVIFSKVITQGLIDARDVTEGFAGAWKNKKKV